MLFQELAKNSPRKGAQVVSEEISCSKALFQETLQKSLPKQSSKVVFLCKMLQFLPGAKPERPLPHFARVALKTRVQCISLPRWATLSFRARQMLKTVVRGKCLGSPSNPSLRVSCVSDAQSWGTMQFWGRHDANKCGSGGFSTKIKICLGRVLTFFNDFLLVFLHKLPLNKRTPSDVPSKMPPWKTSSID